MTMTAEQKAKAKKIYNIITTVIFAVVFVFLIFVVIFSTIQKKQGSDVKIFGHYMYTVLTDSMQPTLNPSDVIWAKAIEEDDLVEGAIITFVAPSGALRGYNETHRIVEIEYDENGNITGIYTKGDNCDQRDDWKLSASDVKAVMSKKLVLISALIKFITNYRFLAYIVLIVLPLMLVIVMFAISFIREKTKEKRREKARAYIENMSDEEKEKMLAQLIELKNKLGQALDSSDGCKIVFTDEDEDDKNATDENEKDIENKNEIDNKNDIDTIENKIDDKNDTDKIDE